MSSAITERSFLISTLFVSFSCLFVLARTSSTLLNKSSEKGNPCLLPGKFLLHSVFGEIYHK